jgi:hypothetical protein
VAVKIHSDPTTVEDWQTCGLVMPISAWGNYDAQHWLDVREILERAISDAGLECLPVWTGASTDIIHGRIIKNIYDLPLVIVDASGLNPNVMFELGMRVTFKKPVIIVADDQTKIPFDTGVIEHEIYPANLYFQRVEEFVDRLVGRIDAVQESVKEKTYKAYLDSFGAFTVVEPHEKKVEFDDFLIDRLDRIAASVARLERDRDREQQPGILASQVFSTGWSDDRIELLKRRWMEGRTASEIAEELGGVSRNAVIGKAHRIGLEPRPFPPPKG